MAKKPRLKVGLVFDDSLDSNDGVAQYVKTLGTWLSRQGHDVSYLVGETKLQNWQGGKVYSLAKNLKVRFNGNKLSIPLPANKKRIADILDNEKFDVLHVMMPHSPFMAQRVVNSAPPATVIIGTFHVFPAGHLAKIGGRLLSIWYGRKIKRISPIFSVSAPAQTYAEQTFSISSEIIPNLVDISRFAGAQSEEKDNDIIFLGRLVDRKGCAELIEAFYILNKRLPQAKLVIAGTGPQQSQLQRRVLQLGLQDKAKFLGYISEEEKPKLLGSAKIACFPSMYGESFGIVLVEAMAAGAEVVLGGNNPGYKSVLGKQPQLLIDPRNSESLAGRLEQLLSDRQLRAELQAWQLDEVKQYDINVVGQQIMDAYNQQIARQAKKSNNKTNE